MKNKTPNRKPAKKVILKGQAKAQASTEGGEDIIKLILEDHKPLKKLIKVLKDSENPIDERREAFEEFAMLLTAHAKAEEQVLYVYMKKDAELREEGFEGDVEHGLADQMVEETKRTKDEDQWSARVKVLAELVEHHIKEEEDEMFPDVKSESSKEERVSMGDRYTQLHEKFLNEGEDSPSERKIEKQERVASRSV